MRITNNELFNRLTKEPFIVKVLAPNGLHGLFHIPVGLTLNDRFALIMQFLTLGNTDLYFCTSIFKIHFEWN